MLSRRRRSFPIVRHVGLALVLTVLVIGVERAVVSSGRDVVRAETDDRIASWVERPPSAPDWRGVELWSIVLPPVDAAARARAGGSSRPDRRRLRRKSCRPVGMAKRTAPPVW